MGVLVHIHPVRLLHRERHEHVAEAVQAEYRCRRSAEDLRYLGQSAREACGQVRRRDAQDGAVDIDR
jgi:hypothetical protein